MSITPELALQIQLLSYLDKEFASDLITALYEFIQGFEVDPDELPLPVKDTFIYWCTGGRIDSLKS